MVWVGIVRIRLRFRNKRLATSSIPDTCVRQRQRARDVHETLTIIKLNLEILLKSNISPKLYMGHAWAYNDPSTRLSPAYAQFYTTSYPK